MREEITSRDNSLLRLARAVRDGKDNTFIFIEGMRLAEEALRSRLDIDAVIVSDELAAKPKSAELIQNLENAARRTALVSETLLERISYTTTPQGVVLLAMRPSTTEERFSARQPQNPLVIVMHRINNPVNVGAILRTAEAAGATGAVVTKESSDPLSPKSLRGAMGSAFRLPLWFGPTYDEVIAWFKSRELQTVCADVHATKIYQDIDMRASTAIIMGPESTGLTEEEIRAADAAVKIPMSGPADSLNVAVAAGVLLYEAATQRRQRANR